MSAVSLFLSICSFKWRPEGCGNPHTAPVNQQLPLLCCTLSVADFLTERDWYALYCTHPFGGSCLSITTIGFKGLLWDLWSSETHLLWSETNQGFNLRKKWWLLYPWNHEYFEIISSSSANFNHAKTIWGRTSFFGTLILLVLIKSQDWCFCSVFSQPYLITMSQICTKWNAKWSGVRLLIILMVTPWQIPCHAATWNWS